MFENKHFLLSGSQKCFDLTIFYVPDLCSGSMFRIYVPDLCSRSMFRIYVPAKAARVARTAKMGPTLQNVEKLKFDKGIDKGTTREKSG